jgi:excisionase family DNA binding protein
MRVTDIELISADENEKPTLRKIEGVLNRETHLPTSLNSSLPKLVGANGETLEIPQSVVRVLQLAVDYMIQGKAFVSLIPYDQPLTIQEATDFLNVPKAFLTNLLEMGELPFVEFGTRKFVRFGDLLEYKNRIRQEQHKALTEMAELSQETETY